MPEVRVAKLDDLPAIETTLGLAFADDPVWLWVMGARRVATRTGVALGAFARLHIGDGTVWVTDDGSAVAIWAGPKRWRVAPLPFLRHGGWPLLQGGPRSVRRFLQLGETEKRHPREEHWYLEVLGTRPDRQGEGLGSLLIGTGIGRADDEGLPAYLESSKETNVPFYRRHGFEVTGEITPKGGPTMWTMWRDARG